MTEVADWDPEIEVDESLARELIRGQFPTLDTGSLRGIGEGWDYTIWATSEGVAFRFPRREIVIPGMRREMNALPWLSEQLPAAVPNARYPGVPTAKFPWPFFGSQLIAGTELTRAHLPGAERNALAQDLGAFLARLHSIAPSAELAGVRDPQGRGDMKVRVPRTRDAIDRVRSHWTAADQAEPILASAEKLETEDFVVLTHGDLHLRQILVSETGRLSGVLDWVDICVAPTSLDLAPYWSLFPVEHRATFLRAYGPAGADTLLRARVLALCLSAMLAAYAIDRGDELLLAETLAELDRALMD